MFAFFEVARHRIHQQTPSIESSRSPNWGGIEAEAEPTEQKQKSEAQKQTHQKTNNARDDEIIDQFGDGSIIAYK